MGCPNAKAGVKIVKKKEPIEQPDATKVWPQSLIITTSGAASRWCGSSGANIGWEVKHFVNFAWRLSGRDASLTFSYIDFPAALGGHFKKKVM